MSPGIGVGWGHKLEFCIGNFCNDFYCQEHVSFLFVIKYNLNDGHKNFLICFLKEMIKFVHRLQFTN